jgi:sulfotransferase family protein
MSNTLLIKNSELNNLNLKRIKADFDLGDEFDKRGQYERAWHHYRRGNAAKFADLDWQDDLEDFALSEAIQTFSAEFIRRHQRPKKGGTTPIFIIGMPRSGSTLIEQILDMHPSIKGAGETPYMMESIATVLPHEGQFPKYLDFLAGRDYDKIRLRYMQKLTQAAPDASHIVDKMLANFYYVGMIKILWPDAKIINTQRDKFDCMMSCYSKLFNEDNLGFTYDIQTLDRYYRRYDYLMGHWHNVLPARSIFTVEYEKTVADFETSIRAIFDYLELPFYHDCLRFHENTRVVKTASKDQVNKPLFASSIGRSKPYLQYITPLLG